MNAIEMTVLSVFSQKNGLGPLGVNRRSYGYMCLKFGTCTRNGIFGAFLIKRL